MYNVQVESVLRLVYHLKKLVTLWSDKVCKMLRLPRTSSALVLKLVASWEWYTFACVLRVCCVRSKEKYIVGTEKNMTYDLQVTMAVYISPPPPPEPPRTIMKISNQETVCLGKDW